MILQVATNTLERVAPLTHAVGNVLKRVFVIGFSIVVFGKPPSLLSSPEEKKTQKSICSLASNHSSLCRK